jgi:hypothetical protein
MNMETLKTTKDPTIEAQPIPEEMEASSEENAENQVLTPDADLESVQAEHAENVAQITALEKKSEDWKAQMALVRGALGADAPSDEAFPEQDRLLKLQDQKKEIEGKQEEAETVKNLEGVLVILHELPPQTLHMIQETGKMPDGSAVKTKDGKPVNPDIAKKLAGLAEKGVMKLTKAILGTVLAVVKGVIKGVFGAISEN